jgi:tetraacyldisaccharide-1-P 4'-kinase
VAGLAWLAARETDLRTVVLEDGYQNPAGRHLDVLILDRWSVAAGPDGDRLRPAAGPVAPWGPWRESARGARRADVLLVEAEATPDLGTDGQAVLSFARRLRLDRAVAAGTPWLAVSGIARPEPFEADAAAVLGCAPRSVVRCRDHADYDRRLRELVLAEVRRAGDVLTVTTAKDWVKLRRFWPGELPVAVAGQDLAWTGKKALPELVGERLDACRR